jgi:F0F1-type ATP synthase delta subunit
MNTQELSDFERMVNELNEIEDFECLKRFVASYLIHEREKAQALSKTQERASVLH